MNTPKTFWTFLRERWQQRRRQAETVRALGFLDTRGLRDLGLDRSEIGSISAEASGLADPTRLNGFRPYY